jgi:hypothetical protein
MANETDWVAVGGLIAAGVMGLVMFIMRCAWKDR